MLSDFFSGKYEEKVSYINFYFNAFSLTVLRVIEIIVLLTYDSLET